MTGSLTARRKATRPASMAPRNAPSTSIFPRFGPTLSRGHVARCTTLMLLRSSSRRWIFSRLA